MIGGDVDLIYNNLCRLIACGARVRVRVPLIPGFNTAKESCQAMCAQLRDAGVREVDLLPFHRMGSGKYRALGLPYAYENVEPLTPEELSQIASIYRQYFEITVEN